MSILSRTQISRMDEKQLRQEVIIPLLQAMGFSGVFEWHGGPAELGKDVVAWKNDVLGNRTNLVVVAKATRLSKNPELHDVAAQVAQAFNTPFEDRETNFLQRAHECWIVSNKGLSKETTRRIWATLPQDKMPWIRVLGEHELWEHVKRNLTVTLEAALGDIQTHLAQLESKLPIRVSVTKQERKIEFLQPETPTDVEEYLHFSAKFQFNNDEQGRSQMEEVRALFETGAPVTVPGANFMLTLPKELTRVIEQVTGQQGFNFDSVSISSVPSTTVFPVRVEVSTPDGRSASLPSIDLRVARTGSTQITLDNGLQQYPILVELTHHTDEGRGVLRVEQKSTQITASLLANFIEFMELFGKAGAATKIRSIETDVLVTETRRTEDAGYSFDSEWTAVVRDLAQIQGRVNVPILLPEGEISQNDRRGIGQLRRILRNGEWEVSWNSDLKMSFAARDIPDVIARFDQRRSRSVWFERDESIELFGVSIPIGRVRYHIYEALLSNREAALSQARSTPDQESELQLELVAGENSQALVTYLDWKEDAGTLDGLLLVASANPPVEAGTSMQVAVDSGTR